MIFTLIIHLLWLLLLNLLSIWCVFQLHACDFCNNATTVCFIPKDKHSFSFISVFLLKIPTQNNISYHSYVIVYIYIYVIHAKVTKQITIHNIYLQLSTMTHMLELSNWNAITMAPGAGAISIFIGIWHYKSCWLPHYYCNSMFVHICILTTTHDIYNLLFSVFRQDSSKDSSVKTPWN